MDIDDVFLAKVMLASLEPVRCWPGACSFYGTALLALGWSCTGLGVTVAVRRVPVLRHARGQGLRRTSRARCLGCLRGSGGGGGWGGGPGVDSARDGVLPDPLALSEVVGLPEIMLRQALAALYRISWRCLRFSSSTRECSSSWTRLSSCPLRADSAGVQAFRKLWCSTVAVLDQSGHARCCDDRCIGVQFLNKVDMPVVATTGALGCSS